MGRVLAPPTVEYGSIDRGGEGHILSPSERDKRGNHHCGRNSALNSASSSSSSSAATAFSSSTYASASATFSQPYPFSKAIPQTSFYSHRASGDQGSEDKHLKGKRF